MCAAFEEVRKEGYDRGMQQGVKLGEKKGAEEEKLSNIRSFMSSMNMSAKSVMDALNIPQEQQEKYAAILAGGIKQ